MPTTLEISRKAKPHQIYAVATQIGVRADELEVFGSYKAKVSLKALERRASSPNAKLICVTGITPTRGSKHAMPAASAIQPDLIP